MNKSWTLRQSITPTLLEDYRLAARALYFVAGNAELPAEGKEEYKKAARRFEARIRKINRQKERIPS